jgi:hypothetical protein
MGLKIYLKEKLRTVTKTLRETQSCTEKNSLLKLSWLIKVEKYSGRFLYLCELINNRYDIDYKRDT